MFRKLLAAILDLSVTTTIILPSGRVTSSCIRSLLFFIWCLPYLLQLNGGARRLKWWLQIRFCVFLHWKNEIWVTYACVGNLTHKKGNGTNFEQKLG